MEPEFWLEKWASDRIGFHEPAPHPLLRSYWSALEVAPAARVFVPLCGKSLDMRWLHDAGHTVLGVELSAIAVRDFFAERGLHPTLTDCGPFVVHRAARYSLLCGDAFALDAHALGQVDAIYDRAALIALPAPLRAAYATLLDRLCAPGTPLLLITVSYAEARIEPPPFVVEEAELETLFGAAWSIERLAEAAAEVKGESAREVVFLLRKR